MEQPYDSRPSELRSLEAAQRTADWLPEYLYGNDTEPAELSVVSTQRLEGLFGEADDATNLGRLKTLFQQLSAGQQAAAGLYIAGYDDKAINALSEVAVVDVLRHLQELAVDTSKPAAATAPKWASGSAYIPLTTVTDLLARSAHIDEEKFINDRVQIQQLAPEVLKIRTGWAMQYVSGSSVTMWEMILNDWLSDMTLDELAQQHSLPASELANRLGRIAKVLLREPQAVVRRQAERSDLEWQDRALCLHIDGDAFFPEKGHAGNEVKEKFCSKCPVRTECGEYERRTGNSYGIWAGLSSAQRRKPHSA